MEFRQSSKLNEVCYEIRGPVIEQANALEEAGHSVLRLNTGNPALFGFEAPEEIVQDMIRMLPQAHGYTDSRGILSARRAVAQRYQAMGLTDVDVDDIFLGNGVSELISMAVQGLLEDGDEILIPSPDYPLWTAVTTLAGGKAVHYTCDEGRTGTPTSPTWPRRSPTAPGPWSSSTRTTRRAPSTPARSSTACSTWHAGTG